MPFTTEPTGLAGLTLVIPRAFEDERGFFMEVYRRDQFEGLGLPGEFVQENHSQSRRDVVRGLHFQWEPPMAKFMRVTAGEAFLVAVDIRPGSETLGKWFGVRASAENRLALYGEAGFARGFAALSDVVDVQYLCTGTYNAGGESGIRWDDPAIGVEWPVAAPKLSAKDADAQTLAEWLARPEAEHFRIA
jgi:dTDP-4-dehydrorhamnose 3,5-epimerase